MPAFSKILDKRLNELEMTSKEFADLVETHKTVITMVRKNKRGPPMNHIEKWADKLSLSKRDAKEFILAAHIAHSNDIVQKHVEQQEKHIKNLEKQLSELKEEQK